jgi:phytanoyl-CoA hydroxylase
MLDTTTFDLDRDGLTILKRVHRAERVELARRFLATVVDYAERGLEDPFTSYYLPHRADQGVLYDVIQRHPELWDFAREPRVLDALVSALGDDVFIYENSVVYKPKGRRNAVPFHQDFISRPDEPLKLIAWTALDRITVETGAMKVIPGSHVKGFLPWFRVKGETHHDRIQLDSLPHLEAIHAELDPGDVLVFNQLLVHGSDEVHTDSLRLALRVSYQGFGRIEVPRGSPIVVRGGDPAALSRRFPGAAHSEELALWRRAARRAGRWLAKI